MQGLIIITCAFSANDQLKLISVEIGVLMCWHSVRCIGINVLV